MTILMILGKHYKTDPRVLKEAESLTKAGNKVVVIEYSNDFCLEKYNDVDILYVNRKRKLKDIKKNFNETKPDIIVSHDLPTLPISIILKIIFKTKMVYDSHELYSETFQFNKNKVKKLFYQLIEKCIIKYANVIITVNPFIRDELKKRYKLKKNIHIIYNCEVFRNSIDVKRKLEDTEKNILFIGALREGLGIENFINAFKYLDDNYRFSIIGDGPIKNRLERNVVELDLQDKIHFFGYKMKSEIKDVIEKTKLGIVLFSDTCLNYYYASPNKLFEYIAWNIPIAVSDLPFLRKITLENDIGFVLEKEPKEIAEQIKTELSNEHKMRKYKDNMKDVYKNKFNWGIEETKLVSIYNSLKFDV